MWPAHRPAQQELQSVGSLGSKDNGAHSESPADKGRPHGPGPEGDAHLPLWCFPKNLLLKKCIEETWVGGAAGNLVAQFRMLSGYATTEGLDSDFTPERHLS